MRQGTLFCVLFAVLWMVTQAISPLLARQDGTGVDPQAPNSSNEERQLNVRYAQAHLNLVEARLAELVDRNRRAPNTIRPAAIQLAQESVGKARQRLESARNESANESQAYVVRAEAELRAAEQELARAEKINQRLANSVSPAELARLKAQRELARIKVEKARHLASESPLSNIRFEIDQLREDVEELRLREAMSRRGS